MHIVNRNRSKRKPMAEINVVPYIDVMLVLLVIFMITAPLLSQGVKVDLPKTVAKTLDNKSREPIIVSVDERGNYYLNIAAKPNMPISAAALTQRVAAELGVSKGRSNVPFTPRQVLVKGDRHVDYGKVVAAMVLLQQAGAQKVGLITDPEKN